MKKFIRNCTLFVECGPFDKEVLISNVNKEVKIIELVVYGDKTVERIFFERSMRSNLKKISIINTSISNLKFLKFSDFSNLNELIIRDNHIKTNKNEILGVVSSLKEIKKIDLSNTLPPFSERCNRIVDFDSKLKLPDSLIVENCKPYDKENYQDTIERLNKTIFHSLQNFNYNEVRTEEKFHKNIIHTSLILQFFTILLLLFVILKRKIKKENTLLKQRKLYSGKEIEK